MKKVQVIFIVLLYALQFLLFGQERRHIGRIGKPIQVDAFLIEWSSESADTLPGTVTVIWDAVNTSQGLSGYIRFIGKDSCFVNAVNIYPDMRKMHRSLKMGFDTTTSGFYAFEKSLNGDAPSIIAEWSIPWDSISLDSLRQYEVGILASDNCGNSLKPIIMYGRRSGDAHGKIFTRKVNMQIITIVILLLLFLRLRARAKKLNSKRGK